MPPTILYDIDHPTQRAYTQITNWLRARADRLGRLTAYYRRKHQELAAQRALVKDDLHASLCRVCQPFDFSDWQRAIRWKYSPHPFCTVGSTRECARFNVGGTLDSSIYPVFSALYLAEDKDTVLQEALGQGPPPVGSKLTSKELALSNPQSEVLFSVSGHLDEVIDISELASLSDFVALIKDFTIPQFLRREAAKLPIRESGLIRTPKALQESLLNANWRQVPTMLEVPSNSQIFGQIVMEAGIAAILYPSRFTGKKCLAVFPRNLRSSGSWLQLADDPPRNLIGPARIDKTNWEHAERPEDQLPC